MECAGGWGFCTLILGVGIYPAGTVEGLFVHCKQEKRRKFRNRFNCMLDGPEENMDVHNFGILERSDRDIWRRPELVVQIVHIGEIFLYM